MERAASLKPDARKKYLLAVVNLLKKLSVDLHVYAPMKKVQRYFFPDAFTKKYGNVRRYVLNKEKIQVIYDTTSSYSKKWFYPRYDNGNIHEPIATDIFINRIGMKDCVFDIGSHLGYFTCLAGKVTHSGHVHAFEVDPNCIHLIRKNLKINRLKNVVINNCAVSDHNDFEKIPLTKNPDPRMKINQDAKRFRKIAAVKIDEYVKAKSADPDFIKIDVEGAELKVLNGMLDLLNKNDIKLLIEIHVASLLADFNTDFKQVLGLLKDKGFQIEQIESHRNKNSTITKLDRHSELSGNTMIFCFKKNTDSLSQA